MQYGAYRFQGSGGRTSEMDSQYSSVREGGGLSSGISLQSRQQARHRPFKWSTATVSSGRGTAIQIHPAASFRTDPPRVTDHRKPSSAALQLLQKNWRPLGRQRAFHPTPQRRPYHPPCRSPPHHLRRRSPPSRSAASGLCVRRLS